MGVVLLVGETGIYVTWVTGAIISSVALMWVFKPPWARITLNGFQDMFRRYWMHGIVVFSIYIWKDLFDGIDRLLMANTRIDMTSYIYAIEGDIVLWFQQTFENQLLTSVLTHFYVAGYMMIMFSAFVYTCYFDDRHMADRITLVVLLVYFLALPFYLFFNVRVTGDFIPEMQTLGYHLTPEIETWFTRIDPFTNGMPSLHIGMPFAFWYCFARNDLDGRWKMWRLFLILYTSLTAFTILYLGIHWVSDIIGGLIVGLLAVHISERISPKIWWLLDERSFLHRTSWLLADWRRPVNEILAIFKSGINWVRYPGTKQTSTAIVLLLLATSLTLLWDATHQHFPAEGVTHPDAASGADGWLTSYEVIDEGNISVSLWNLSTEDSYQRNVSINTSWGDFPLEILVGSSHIVVWHGHQLEFFNTTSNQWEDQWFTEPLFDDIDMLSNGDEDWPRMLMLNDGTVEIHSRSSLNATAYLPAPPSGPVSIIASSDNRVAYVEQSQPMTINVQTIDGFQRHVRVEINSTISEERDAEVYTMTGTLVDYQNATINEITLDNDYLVAMVNISAVNRLVLVNLVNGEQYILGDPIFPVDAPSIGHDFVAWQHRQFLVSLNPHPTNIDWEISYHDISENQTYQLHTPDEIDQINPQVMEGHIAWLQIDENGDTEIRVWTNEVVFEKYSSLTLQIFVVIFPLLLIILAGQRLSENHGHILPFGKDQEEE